MKRIAIAMAVSLLLHLALFLAPGWRLPMSDGLAEQPPLEAHLAAPKVRKVAVRVAERPVRRKPARPVGATPRQPFAEQQQAVPAVALSAPPAAPIAPAPAPEPIVETARQAEVARQIAQPPEPAAAVLAEPLLPRHGRIRFAVMRGDDGFVVGQAVHRWHHDGKTYEINSVTETTGLAALFKRARVTQTSAGEITTEGLKPHEYRTQRNDLATEAATFDWQGQVVSYSGQRKAPLLPGSQDMLSLFYQLGQQAGQERTEILIATGKKYERYVFASLGEEHLATRFGEQRVLHLRTVGEQGSEATEVWLGLDMHGLPLKVRYTDRNGDSFQQVAEEVEFDDNESAQGGKLPETGR